MESVELGFESSPMREKNEGREEDSVSIYNLKLHLFLLSTWQETRTKDLTSHYNKDVVSIED